MFTEFDFSSVHHHQDHRRHGEMNYGDFRGQRTRVVTNTAPSLRPAPTILSRTQRRSALLVIGILFFALFGIIGFSVLNKQQRVSERSPHHYTAKTEQEVPPPPLPPPTAKRVIAKTKTLEKPLPPLPPPPPPLTIEVPRIIEKKQDTACAVGWHLENGVCEKNAYEPNPVDREMMNTNAKKGSTPYQYACGAYVDDPMNLERDTTFLYTYHNNRKLMREIALSKPSPIIAAFMDSCERREENSLVLDKLLVRVELMESLDELPEVMGLLHRYDTTLPIELSFELDLLDGTRLVPLIKQSGIFANQVGELKEAFHIAQVAKRFMGTLCDDNDNALKMARDVVNIELSLASAQHFSDASNILDYVDRYKRQDLLYDWDTHMGETMLHHGNFNLTGFLAATIDPTPQLSEVQFLNSLKIRPMWVYSRSYMERFAQLHRSHTLEAWKNYLSHAVLFNLVNDDSPHIDPELHYAYHRNYESRYALPWKRPRRFLTVSPNQPEFGGKSSKADALSIRHHQDVLEECAYISEAYLPVMIDDFFIHTRLDDELRTHAQQVVSSIQQEFISALEDEESDRFSYFSKESREFATNKVRAMQFIIGAPAHWEERDERTKQFVGAISAEASFTDNMLAVRHFHMQEQALFYHQHVRSLRPVDRSRLFDGMVSTVNAFYQHQLNTIIISAGILQPPIFSKGYDLEAWYARLGVFVAHEMSHSLDTIGVHFAGNGSVCDWVSPSEKKDYDLHNRHLISLYSTFTDNGNRHDGTKTLNENVADQIGFPLALAAAHRASKKPLDLEEFFLSYAQLYCEAISDEHEKHMIATQKHSVGSMRVNKVLQAQPEFVGWWQETVQFSQPAEINAKRQIDSSKK